MVVKKVGFVVDLGMAFVDNWGVGKENGCYWLSNDVVELVGDFSMKERQHAFLLHSHPLHLPQFSHSSKQDDFKFSSFQTHFDPFASEDQIRKN